MRTILLVEDNNDIRENASEMLELAGYNRCIKWKDRTAIGNGNFPDIILSDVMMPVMNGHELFNELKKDEKTRKIPFIFLTSSVEKKEIEVPLGKGADTYIGKPFEEKELFNTIEHCLNIK